MTTAQRLQVYTSAMISTVAEVGSAPEVSLYLGAQRYGIDHGPWSLIMARAAAAGWIVRNPDHTASITDKGRQVAAYIDARAAAATAATR